MQEADQAFVADLLFAQRQPFDRLPRRHTVFLRPLTADDAMVGRSHILPFLYGGHKASPGRAMSHEDEIWNDPEQP
jgi:hypothetical protein